MTTEIKSEYNRMEAAVRMGISRATIDRLRQRGEIAEIRKSPHKVRITEDAIQQYFASHTKHAKAG